MSKINILGIVSNIRSKSNVYTPIIEAVVNSIDAIQEAKKHSGEIIITVKRDKVFQFEDSLSDIKSIEIQDNGIGFTQTFRDSFDTLYSEEKKLEGGKGFGRFMFIKYFSEVRVESTYKEGDDYWLRKFNFGKQFDIIVNETKDKTTTKKSYSKVYLNNLIKEKQFDKELETIARKLLEKLLIFFVNEKFNCPQIILKEEDNSKQIILNNYLSQDNEIKLISSKNFSLESVHSVKTENFDVKIFKIYFPGSQKSKISLTAHNREVTETTLQNYVPEFEDDFFDEVSRGDNTTRKNYIIKAYVLGKYLNENVSLERETFNFEKDKSDNFYEFSQADIERKTAELVKEIFNEDVKVRAEKKRAFIVEYVNHKAPWHKTYVKDLDYASISYNLNDEKIELALQTIKFHKEQEVRREVKEIIESTDEEFEEKFDKIISKVTDVGKNDLAHYVCTRKTVLQIFQELLRRGEDGNSRWEKEIHNVIFPMVEDSETISYEDHNLWLLDERLVFSEYIASDRKISKQKDALDEPDLIIFNKKNSFRSGDNEFSNPLTIFEFKRPKRENYKQDEDPVLQIGNYLEKIRAGKYELPDGIEKIKVNGNTPVYAYVICDMAEKIREFAKIHQLIVSPDDEGYFGFHSGYKMYVELISFRKLLKDANLRNKIFFKKLGIE